MLSGMQHVHDRPRIFTWHIHGSYLYYLSQGNYEVYIPVNREKSAGYYGRGETFPFGNNLHEVPVEQVSSLEFDCILFQSAKNYAIDQYEVLSQEQRKLPKLFLEHDPPRKHPTDTKHVVDDPNILLVHVTRFNQLMWDNNRTPNCVIDHGVVLPDVEYSGEIDRGIVVINNLQTRGRRLGLDIFLEMKKHIPLDLIGMGSEELGGLGEIPYAALPEFIRRYRFFFNPIRYTSLGLSVCEAMMIGLPVIGLATTEMVTVIENDVSGFLHTDVDLLIEKCRTLLEDRTLAIRLGKEARKEALRRFNIERFTEDWETLFQTVINASYHPALGNIILIKVQ